MTVTRRRFLSMVATGVAAPLVVGGCEDRSLDPKLILDRWPMTPQQGDARVQVFDLSVASGDPTESGVVLWTHINPSHVVSDEPLYFQVAEDEAFARILADGEVPADSINADRDYTVSLDLDGQLPANRRLYYRFSYAGIISRTGRCRTTPQAGTKLETLKFGLLTCQDYTNGYYGALNYLAADDSVDFVIHLGDFIYETVGDPRFQDLPFPDRQFTLPSGSLAAMDLMDYRHIYRTYRSDRNLQLLLEQHTLIIATDDHETSNDCYWDYQRDTLGAPDHPYSLEEEFGNDPALLTQLKLDSQRAWAEYVPARIEMDETAEHPHQYTRIYRQLQFGGLADLFMLDTRTYRSGHPCGEGDIFQRYAAFDCGEEANLERTMLGDEQRQWLDEGVSQSSATWKLLGNQTYMGRLGLMLPNDGNLNFNMDAWDGYQAERDQLMASWRSQDVEDLVVLTGDLHSYIASHVKNDYSNIDLLAGYNYFAVEFMTPSVTSAGLGDMLLSACPDEEKITLVTALSQAAVRVTNPHIAFFDSMKNGYSTLQLTDTYCEWRAFAVDKDQAAADNPLTEIYNCRKYRNIPWIL